MNTKLKHWLALASAAAIAACGAAKASTAITDTATGGPVSVSLSLDTPASIVLGEPILVKYRIVNNAPDQRLGLHMGVYGTDWYTISLTDAGGHAAAAIPDTRPAQPGGLHEDHNRFLDVGSRAADAQEEAYIVVPRAVALTRPGSYTLTVHVHLAYALGPAQAVGSRELQALIQASRSALDHDYVFPLTVAPADTARLAQTAESLRQEIVKRPWGVRALALADALFAMPEPAAAATWQALADNPGVGLPLYTRKLMDVATPGAYDILAGMYLKGSSRDEDHAHIGNCIRQMYDSGGPSLKAYIRQMTAAQGIPLDDLPGLSSPLV